MKKKSFIPFFNAFVLALGIVYNIKAQEQIGMYVQQSKIITHTQKTPLFLIDFWATYCVPCVYSNEYLSILQKQNKDELFVLSLSNESIARVKRHLIKHPTQLAVGITGTQDIFTKYKVTTLPYAVLFNAKGEALWKGNPTNLTQKELNKFKSKYNDLKVINSFFTEEELQETAPEEAYIPKNDFEITQLPSKASFLISNNLENYTTIEGSLTEIIAYALKTHKSQISIPDNINKTYKIYFSKKIKSNWLDNLLTSLALIKKAETNVGEYLLFNTEEATLWDTAQINWGDNAHNILIGDSDLQADNFSLYELQYYLSNVLDLPIVYTANTNLYSLHDWQIHYKFFNLMQSSLLDSYNIKIEKKEGSYSVYSIEQKKAP